MPTEPYLTCDRLREVLDYDAATGVFRWRVQLGNKGPVGCRAGSINVHGYRIIRIDQRDYRAARLAVLFMTGAWPDALVDHIDLCRSNDQWSNLRLATYSENFANRKARRGSKAGVKGVSPSRTPGKWTAKIQVRGETMHLGTYSNIEEAADAYARAARKGFGAFART